MAFLLVNKKIHWMTKILPFQRVLQWSKPHQVNRFFSTSSSEATYTSIALKPTLQKFVPPFIATRIKFMSDRHDQIMCNLQSSSTEDTRELSSLAPIASHYNDFALTCTDYSSLQELHHDAVELNDEELALECQTDLEELYLKMKSITDKLMAAVLPQPEDEESDAVLELRAGTGGDEACLFSSELLASYEKIAKEQNFAFETLSINRTDLGGIKEASISISSKFKSGRGPYGYFKFESGVHRVQRVPVNDVRIHTSAASVAVLPAASSSGNKNDLLPTTELRIDTMRASGAGGQHVNTTDSAVRITHIPTGITASIQDERSQHKNKAKALKLISARVRDAQRAEDERKRGEQRSGLMGGGDRSERIRTYNYPQDRVTDHRCKHSEFGIEKLLGSGGGVARLVPAFATYLRKIERVELLKELESSETDSGK